MMLEVRKDIVNFLVYANVEGKIHFKEHIVKKMLLFPDGMPDRTPICKGRK